MQVSFSVAGVFLSDLNVYVSAIYGPHSNSHVHDIFFPF